MKIPISTKLNFPSLFPIICTLSFDDDERGYIGIIDTKLRWGMGFSPVAGLDEHDIEQFEEWLDDKIEDEDNRDTLRDIISVEALECDMELEPEDFIDRLVRAGIDVKLRDRIIDKIRSFKPAVDSDAVELCGGKPLVIQKYELFTVKTEDGMPVFQHHDGLVAASIKDRLVEAQGSGSKLKKFKKKHPELRYVEDSVILNVVNALGVKL